MIFNSLMVGNSGGGSDGGSFETCTVTINELTGSWFKLSYLDANGAYQETGEMWNTATIEVPVNSLILFEYAMQPYFMDATETFHLLNGGGSNPAVIRFSGDGSANVVY